VVKKSVFATHLRPTNFAKGNKAGGLSKRMERRTVVMPKQFAAWRGNDDN
jgi:hypothetical protein